MLFLASHKNATGPAGEVGASALFQPFIQFVIFGQEPSGPKGEEICTMSPTSIKGARPDNEFIGAYGEPDDLYE
jgi:hypothetical protein